MYVFGVRCGFVLGMGGCFSSLRAGDKKVESRGGNVRSSVALRIV